MYQVWLKSLDIFSSYRPEIPNQSLILMHVPSLVKVPWHLLKLSSGNQIMGVSRADNSVEIWRKLPKPDLHNINPYTKVGENPC